MATKIPDQSCWKCGYKMNSTTEAYGDHAPSEGDATMCISCGAIAVFSKELVGRKPTPEEQMRFDANEQITDAQIARAHLVGDKLKGKQHADS